eukprot:PLAT8663.2.p1 GENE.PLAT8663.2~~PLAT8663.2.p1  ORF type:complete len:189 (+),score=86.79 PLAT8663.2:73-567(+)
MALKEQYGVKIGWKEMSSIYDTFRRKYRGSQLTREQFYAGFRDMGITDEAMLEQYFNAFDYDGNGTVSFEEFVCGLSILRHGTMEERLDMAFKAFDADGSGFIEPAELTSLFRATCGLSEEAAYNLAEKTFAEIDLDNDGRLSYEEFKVGVLRNQILVNAFWAA